ncbi:MAG TPA: membrane dipeptidase [Gemmatimonadales bacterium]|nr:membrane dipeptidase [Gemmatimonadales bacterium]
MNRRDFLSAATATGVLGSRQWAPAGASLTDASSPLRSAGAADWSRAPAIDSLVNGGPYFEVDAVIEAGMTGAIVDMSMYPRSFNNAIQALAGWNAAFRRNPKLLKVTRGDDLRAAEGAKRFAIVLACQDAAILDASTVSVMRSNIDLLGVFFDLGLRVLQLTHNERNAVGDSFREKVDAGLSRLGEEVVPAMNELGMLIDLSHCSRLTTLQAARLSSKPVAITHAGCRALHPSARNKTDEEIRAVAEKGGYFGVFNMSLWLTERQTTSIDDLLAHVDHAVKVAGIDHVGFGSDGPIVSSDVPPDQELAGYRAAYERNQGLPGAEAVPHHVTVRALNTPRRLDLLAHGLARRGYGEAAVEKIIGGNIARVLREVLP